MSALLQPSVCKKCEQMQEGICLFHLIFVPGWKREEIVVATQ